MQGEATQEFLYFFFKLAPLYILCLQKFHIYQDNDLIHFLKPEAL